MTPGVCATRTRWDGGASHGPYESEGPRFHDIVIRAPVSHVQHGCGRSRAPFTRAHCTYGVADATRVPRVDTLRTSQGGRSRRLMPSTTCGQRFNSVPSRAARTGSMRPTTPHGKTPAPQECPVLGRAVATCSIGLAVVPSACCRLNRPLEKSLKLTLRHCRPTPGWLGAPPVWQPLLQSTRLPLSKGG